MDDNSARVADAVESTAVFENLQDNIRGLHMNSCEKGNIGLTRVLADLSQKGYNLFLPLSDSTVVDLVAGNESLQLKRIQVKYRKVGRGKITLPLQSVVNGVRRNVDLNAIDIYAVFCPDTDSIYYVGSGVVRDKKYTSALTLQLTKSKKFLFANDFLSIENAWNSG